MLHFNTAKMADESSNNSASNKVHLSSITFGLHPETTLRVSLHKSIPTNPHHVVVNKVISSSIPSNANSETFAIMDASRIISFNQISVAANTALLRKYQYECKNGTSKRGIALETILCCAGSTNTASVLRDYAFDKNSNAAKELLNDSNGGGNDNANGGYDVFCLGYCNSDEEFVQIVESLNLGPSETNDNIHAYLSRSRSEQETNELMKVYKITKEEIEMFGSSLEKAVNNRVAAKFYT